MTDALGLIGLLLLGLSGRSSSQTQPNRNNAPQLPPAPAPWRQAVPDGLPPFPGAGWEYDEPPPKDVQARAAQLVAPLWRQGKGSHRTELTAGRWITYRAEIVRSGKQGVVAYRQKGGTLQSPAKPAPLPPDELASRPSAGGMTLPIMLTSTSPGWPQPMAEAGGRYVDVVKGQCYQWNARVDGPPGLAAEIARGLGLGGAKNIAVSKDPPYILIYQLVAATSARIPLGVAIKIEAGDQTVSITFLAASPCEVPTAPKVPFPPKPKPKDPGGEAWVQTSTPAPGHVPIPVPGGVIYTAPAAAMTIYRRGMGQEPAAPIAEVKQIQQRLGVVPVNGRFGPLTEAAVLKFQRGLVGKVPGWTEADIDGRVGPKTWGALFTVRA